MQDRDPVRQRHRLGLIVGDVDERDAGPPLQVLQLPPHPLAELRVEVRQGLIEQEDLRLDHQAPRQRHTLLLAARELAGEPLFEPGQVHQLEDARDPLARLGPADPTDFQAKGDVLVHGLVRPDRVVLEHHAHAPPLGGNEASVEERVRPSTRMIPASGVRNPAISRRSVVLPQPLGPSSVTNSRSRTSRLSSRTAATEPYRLDTRSIEMPAMRQLLIASARGLAARRARRRGSAASPARWRCR